MRIDELPADVAPPAHFWMPDYEETSGWEAIDFAASIGYDLDAAQRVALQTMFAEKKVDGRWEPAAFEWALICTRQQIKTYLLEAANLADVFVFGNQVVWTAHRVRTTQKTVLRFLQLIESNPDLDRRVLKVSKENGNEWIQTRDDGLIEFMARTEMGGRGFTGNKLTFDEALALTPGMVGSLLPILTARDEAQVRYASSAPKADSTILRSIRDRGRKGGDPDLAYMEYADIRPPSCELGEACTHRLGTRGCCVDDESRWVDANPGIFAGRTTIRKIRSFRTSAMPVAEFTREHMGWGEEPAGEAAIDEPTWSSLLDVDSTIVTSKHFGLNVSPDRKWGCLAIAGLNEGGRVHVEITGRGEHLDYRPGTTWVLDRLAQIHDVFPEMVLAVLAGAATDALLLAIRNLGITVEVIEAKDFAAGCGLLYDEAATKDLVHVGQKDLALAVNATRWRDSGENTKLWGRRRSEGDITPTFAVTLALISAHRAGFAAYDPLDSIY